MTVEGSADFSEKVAFLKSSFLLLGNFFLAFWLRSFRVPTIISFMLVGFGAKLWLSREEVEIFKLFEHLGIILLFFFLGLEYSFERLAGMVRVWKPGFVDFAFNFLLPFPVALALGFDVKTAIFLCAVIYPSSTSIVAKLLMDFRRTVYPEAELLIGILIFEDLVAILLLSVLPSVGAFGEVAITPFLAGIFKIVAVFAVFWVLWKYVVPRLTPWLDRISDDEIFIFFLLGTVLLVGFSFKMWGISEALGAFLLGVLVPETKIMENIEKHLSSFKELSIGLFFFFFAHSAEGITFGEFDKVLVLVMLGVVLKFLSTWIAGALWELKPRARLRSALSFSPRGEFSAVIASLEPSLKTVATPFVFLSALFGSILFALAPYIAEKVYPPKRKRVRTRFVVEHGEAKQKTEKAQQPF